MDVYKVNMVRTIKEAVAKLETNALIYPLVRDDRLSALGYRLLVGGKQYILNPEAILRQPPGFLSSGHF